MSKKDEYSSIYDRDIDDDLSETIEELRGTIGRGDCIYCGGKDSMIYVGKICFICEKCGKSVHEDTYYVWAAGYEIEMEE